MKKTILILILAFLMPGIRAFAAGPEECYIKTTDKTYFGHDLKIGLLHTRIVMPDGTFAEVNNRDIIGYKHHDKLYMLMPVICNKTDTLCLAMMEYVTQGSGCIVFRYCCSDFPNELDKLVEAKKNYFFVYREGKFIRRLNEDQTEALAAFGIKVI